MRSNTIEIPTKQSNPQTKLTFETTSTSMQSKIDIDNNLKASSSHSTTRQMVYSETSTPPYILSNENVPQNQYLSIRTVQGIICVSSRMTKLIIGGVIEPACCEFYWLSYSLRKTQHDTFLNNYRQLNAMTITNVSSIPRID